MQVLHPEPDPNSNDEEKCFVLLIKYRRHFKWRSRGVSSNYLTLEQLRTDTINVHLPSFILTAIWLFSAKFKLKKTGFKYESKDHLMKNDTFAGHKRHVPHTVIGL